LFLLGEAKHSLPTGVLTKLRETERDPLNKVRAPDGIQPITIENYFGRNRKYDLEIPYMKTTDLEN